MNLDAEIMIEYATITGLHSEEFPPKRYLWTDAFAVCNFLGLYQRTGNDLYKRLALQLIDQVHETLGRHRADDSRAGWISGLDEEAGRIHPTAGGLRIGKEKNERKQGESFDEELEWNRDGQYYHYLTQWMHALDCASRVTEGPVFNSWAVELVKAVHPKFIHSLPPGGEEKGIYWKMSIDLSRPLVYSEGHNDPLEGLLTYSELLITAEKFSDVSISHTLDAEIADLAQICEDKDWHTDDSLGIGCLLLDLYKIAQISIAKNNMYTNLFGSLLNDCLENLRGFRRKLLDLPASYRVGYRELGLSIGLQSVEKLWNIVALDPGVFKNRQDIHMGIRTLLDYVHLSDRIKSYWLEPDNRRSETWTRHSEISMVMLATSLFPDGYLSPL